MTTGSVAQAGSRIFISGTSGLNTSALIDAAVQQKTLKADRLDVQIDNNTAKISAYAELETLAEKLETSLSKLKGNPGLFDDDPTVFSQRSGTITTSDGSDYTSVIGISISSDAAIGQYDIEVIQEAQAQKVAGSPLVDKDLALGHTGSFELGIAGRTNTQIDVTAGMSLSDIEIAINAVKDTTGVEASIIKVTETEYTLVLTGLDTAANMVNFQVAGDDVLNLIGVGDGFGGFQNTLQVAQEAVIEIDGVEIRRNDNLFDDVLTGIELDIKGSAPGTIISLDVDNDASAIKDAVLEFIDAYNALRDFVVKNQQVSESGASEDAILFSDTILENIADSLSSIIAQNFNNGSSLETIGDLGISIGNSNRLELIDEEKLDNAILNNFDDVKAAFGSTATSDNAEFALLANASTSTSADIAFNITHDGANITSVTANGDGAAFNIVGNRLEGAAGTAYAGMIFAYQGTTSVTTNASLSQGFADRLTNLLDGFTDDVSGLIVREKASLQGENEELGVDAQEIRDRAETFRLRQVDKYAAFEAKLAGLEILKAQIKAILGNNDDD